MSNPPTSSRAKRHRRSSRVLSWSRRHRFLAAISMVVIAAVPGIAIAAMGDGDGGSPATARQAVPSTGPTVSSRSVTSTAAPTTKAPPSSRATTTAPPAGVAADAAIKGDIVQVEGGAYHTCLRLRRGAVYCWGQGAYGQLGTNTHFRGTPTRSLVIEDAVEVQAGGRFTCARRGDGQVFCWGEDDHGQLGSRRTEPCGDAEIDSVCAPIPARVKGLPGAQGLATGASHACALLRAGAVSCWGGNEHGQLGGSAGGDREVPSPVAGVTGARQVVAGDNHTCALIGRPGSVRCWGDNESGQAAGDGARVTRPVTVPGVSDAVEIIAGGAHTCARRAGGSVACWGYNYLGQLGVGSTRPTSTNRPLAVRGLADAVQLAAGRYHTCARRESGSVACWGLNRKGELGDGGTRDRSAPARVASIGDAQFLAGGRWHFCVLRLTGSVWCWGDNLGGQLGAGDVNDAANPVPVAVRGLPRG